MKTIAVTDMRFQNIDFEITDIFPENWLNRKEFLLYKEKPRPCSALFFVCADIEALFISSDKTAVSAKMGDIVFIPEGTVYYVRVSGKTAAKIDTYTVNINLFDETHTPIILSDGISVLTNRQDNMFGVRLKTLYDIFYRVERTSSTVARNLIKIKGEFLLLLDMIAESASQNSEFYYPIRRGIEAFCEEWNLNEKIEKYAQLSDVSVTYFYRCFRRWSGSSPIEYRNTVRISNAESMLRCTDMKIKEIAETVGFEDPFYFCYLFSKKVGISPQKYRKQL